MMDRRAFGKLATLGLGGSMVGCTGMSGLSENTRGSQSVIKAKALKKGDLIGLLAPGSPHSQVHLERAENNLSQMGYRVRKSKNLSNKYGYLAGSDEERLDDLHAMFSDNEVKGIWCIRGGYGSSRLLPKLDYELIRQNPKVLIGYSDITALLQAIFVKTGLVGFHGPVASSEMTEYTLAQSLLLTRYKVDKYVINQHNFKEEDEAFKQTIIVPGSCTGILAGGNLSLLASLAGTEYGLDASGKVVFIEDIGEKPYRVDRMLTQLLQASNLAKANGIILGVFKDCEADKNDVSLSLMQCFQDRLSGLNIPVYYGFSFGHISDMCTFPVGLHAYFDTASAKLSILESTVS